MIRVYFVFEDPLDETGIKLSFVDVPTQDPSKAVERVEKAADSGELWEHLYPDEQEHPFTLLKTKTMFCEIAAPIPEHTVLLL